MGYVWLVGMRYLKGRRKEAFISIITVISIAGVAVGVMALLVVLGVMNGFEQDLRAKILGTFSHLVVTGYGGGISGYEELIEQVEREEHVEAASPFLEGEVLVKSSLGKVTGALLKGIVPERELKVTNLEKFLRQGDFDLEADESGVPGMVIGRELASRVGLWQGSEATVIASAKGMQDEGAQERVYRIAGIFVSGVYDYDSGIVYSSLGEAQDLFQTGKKATGIQARLDDIYLAGAVAKSLNEKLEPSYRSLSWMERHRNLYAALKLEKKTMFIILALIVLVATFNIVSTLIMVVMEKTKDIGILKSIGANRAGIMGIFLLNGLLIGLVGTVLGGAGGIALCSLLSKYEFVELPPEVYLLDTLPVKMETADFLTISLAAIGLSFLAGLYPAWQAARLDPVEALRYE